MTPHALTPWQRLLMRWTGWGRERYIREAPFPQFLKRKVRDAYPGMSQKEAELVERGLRQFFLVCRRTRFRFVAMPSKVVDTMWHEFILHTQAYRDWCALAMGRFLHHTPAEALGQDPRRNDGLRRAWYWSCRDETIDPLRPTRLPLLFALDAKLQIPDGFRYEPNCGHPWRQRTAGASGNMYVHCATSFTDGSAPGEGGGGFGSDTPGGDGGGDGGGSGDGGSGSGCGGGGGCGGGCGGGGGD